jgi:hypothetical protein
MYVLVDVADDPLEWFDHTHDPQSMKMVMDLLRKQIILRSSMTSPEFYKRIKDLPIETRNVLQGFIQSTLRSDVFNKVGADFKVGLIDEENVFFDARNPDFYQVVDKLCLSRREHQIGVKADFYWESVFGKLARSASSVHIYDSYAYSLIKSGKSLCLEKLLQIQELDISIYTDIQKDNHKARKCDLKDKAGAAQELFADWEYMLTKYRGVGTENTKSRIFAYHPTQMPQHDRRVIFKFAHKSTLVAFEGGLQEFEVNISPVPRIPNPISNQQIVGQVPKTWLDSKENKVGECTWVGATRVRSF